MAKSLNTPRHIALIGELVKARKEAGLTQAQLASMLNRSQSYVAKIEGGERRLDVIEFIEVLDALGTDPARLLRKLQLVRAD